MHRPRITMFKKKTARPISSHTLEIITALFVITIAIYSLLQSDDVRETAFQVVSWIPEIVKKEGGINKILVGMKDKYLHAIAFVCSFIAINLIRLFEEKTPPTNKTRTVLLSFLEVMSCLVLLFSAYFVLFDAIEVLFLILTGP